MVKDAGGIPRKFDLVPQPHLTAGSWGTVTAVPAARQAALDMREALRRLQPNTTDGTSPRQILGEAKRPFLEVEARHKAPGQPDAIFERVATGLLAFVGPEYPDFISFSYIAHFVEVRVEPHTRHAYACRVWSASWTAAAWSARALHAAR
jgi:xanthine dehydrogenase YagR molybdenum-binding subunit